MGLLSKGALAGAVAVPFLAETDTRALWAAQFWALIAAVVRRVRLPQVQPVMAETAAREATGKAEEVEAAAGKLLVQAVQAVQVAAYLEAEAEEGLQ